MTTIGLMEEPQYPESLLGGCLHLNVSDEGICVECSTDITSQGFIDSLPDVPGSANLGNLLGIIQLAQETMNTYVENLMDSRDPNDLKLPKLRKVGSQLIRLSDNHFWMEVVQQSFPKAKELGYRRELKDWDRICRDYLREMTED